MRSELLISGCEICLIAFREDKHHSSHVLMNNKYVSIRVLSDLTMNR